jgi:16S rRNA processing protein RimM
VSTDPDKEIQLGFIAGVHGIKGWLKVHSFTDPRDNVVAHRHWTLRQNGREQRVELLDGARHGKTVIVKIEGIDDRDAAAELIGAEISVRRSELPACKPGEYYWTDLEGLSVRDRNGHELGRVAKLMETGAHDVLVVEGDRERLIPFVLGEVVEAVDLDARTLTVTWDAAFWDD